MSSLKQNSAVPQKSSEREENYDDNKTRTQAAKLAGVSHDTYTNLRQRGDISSSSLKMGRIIDKLEKIYEIKKGRPELNATNGLNKTQSDIADMLGISTKGVQRYKKLTTLIPELQDMVDSDKISASVASRVLARLSPDEHQSKIGHIFKTNIRRIIHEF